MNLQKATLAKIISDEYKFNGHHLEKENVVEIVERLTDIINDKQIKESLIDSFLRKLRIGAIGSLSKNPMDLVVKFYQFMDQNRPKLSS
jgi:hypothetical protein